MMERALFAALAAAALALAWLQQSSVVSDMQKLDRPLMAAVKVSSVLEPGGTTAAPAWYLATYSWDRRTLNLILVGPKSRNFSEIGQSPAWTAALDMPARFGPPDSPEAVKAWIASRPRDVRFWSRLPRVQSSLRKATQPPLSWYDAWTLALEFYRLAPESVRIAWLPKPPQDRRLLSLLLKPDLDAAAENAPLAARTPPVTVQVLNASGEEGVALQATKILRWSKADVVDYGNAAAPADHTRVIDRTGNFGAAKQIRRALDCVPDAEIMTQIEPNWHAAVTVILGKDYRSCRAFVQNRTPS